MQKIVFALVLIILGLITTSFLLNLIPVSIISGFLVLMLGTGLLLAGILKMNQKRRCKFGDSPIYTWYYFTYFRN